MANLNKAELKVTAGCPYLVVVLNIGPGDVYSGTRCVLAGCNKCRTFVGRASLAGVEVLKVPGRAHTAASGGVV